MVLAAGILTWMIFWMSKQSKTIKSELEDGVNKAALTTGKRAVFGLAFLAVVREGVELALFITAAFFAGSVKGANYFDLTGVGWFGHSCCWVGLCWLQLPASTCAASSRSLVICSSSSRRDRGSRHS
ncbi:MAG: FTR1 family protein [Anaerolineales bacterium]|nr:FTR1 family protein [Anaerolineales bacterium]